jgi:hypothetical protein
VLALIALAVLLGIGYWLYRRHKSRKSATPSPTPPAKPRPAMGAASPAIQPPPAAAPVIAPPPAAAPVPSPPITPSPTPTPTPTPGPWTSGNMPVPVPMAFYNGLNAADWSRAWSQVDQDADWHMFDDSNSEDPSDSRSWEMFGNRPLLDLVYYNLPGCGSCEEFKGSWQRICALLASHPFIRTREKMPGPHEGNIPTPSVWALCRSPYVAKNLYMPGDDPTMVPSMAMTLSDHLRNTSTPSPSVAPMPSVPMPAAMTPSAPASVPVPAPATAGPAPAPAPSAPNRFNQFLGRFRGQGAAPS